MAHADTGEKVKQIYFFAPCSRFSFFIIFFRNKKILMSWNCKSVFASLKNKKIKNKMIWQFYCEFVYVVSLVLFGDVDFVKRSFLCFAQHGSAGHHFSKMSAVTIELTEWQNHTGKVWRKSQCSFHFTGMTVKVFIILWMFTLLKRIHNLQWQSLFLHQIVPIPLLSITFKCSKLQSLPTREWGGGGG